MEFLITLSDHWSLMAIKRFLGNKDIVILLNNFVKWFKRKGSPRHDCFEKCFVFAFYRILIEDAECAFE